ncbi:MAG: DUF5596 domain-containing protein [Armatimonadetes bacterium]|nr:DUF5596 domain-containing protein [Armatimonadota bacterium]
MTEEQLLDSAEVVSRHRAALQPHLAESLACLPDLPRFLAPEFVLWAREFAGLPAELDAPLTETARAIAGHAGLRGLIWHQSRLLYDHLDHPTDACGGWPTFEHVLGDQAGLYYLILCFEVLPRMVERHRERGIPESVSRACCTHFRESLRLYGLTRGGALGVSPRVLFWLRNHLAGRLITLGRFEYMVRPFTDRARVFRRRADGAVVALDRGGQWFNAHGYLDAGATSGWQSVYQETESAWTGTPLHPAGHALPDPVSLAKAEWDLALAPGEPILEVHIPAGGQMTLDRALDSMRQAPPFFRRHFADQPFRGFGTFSWILDPEIPVWYGPETNMAQWERELYLFPYPSSGRDGLYFVFGEAPIDPPNLPRDTSLRRAVLDRLAAGGGIRAGGMFVLLDELDALGTQPYRRIWPF